jgi:hypothetical protein
MSRSKPSSPKGAAKPKHSRDIQKLQSLLDESQALYEKSPLSKSIVSMLRTKQRVPLTKAVSLGLGSLVSTDQSRRMKQLTIFLATTTQLSSTMKTPLRLYAQDPSFTRLDETFLESLGIQVLRTPSASSLGEAAEFIDEKTMVFSPFLTIEAYKSVLQKMDVGLLVCDDFDKLRLKWPRFTTEHDDVEGLVKRELRKYQRRAVGQPEKDENVFWEKEDRMFPMALYWRLQEQKRDRAHRIDGDFGYLEKTISARL